MEQYKPNKFIKTKITEFLNEGIDNNDYKVGEIYYYKNQFMDVPKKVIIDDIEEYSNSGINSITIKFNSGDTDRLLKHQFKYLSKQNQIDDYSIVREIGDQIYNITGYSPNQISELFDIIKNNDRSGQFKISFTEEIKDGRSPKFDINIPMKLKGNIIGNYFKLKILDIKYIEKYKQDSEYNDYINYVYIISFEQIQ